MKAYPFQKQEAFLDGHESGFRFVGGVPRRITYDNLKTAVYKVLEGHNRQEKFPFPAGRSYYLFDSYYCTPPQGHEKGGVENDVGYVQRYFFFTHPASKKLRRTQRLFVGMLFERRGSAYPGKNRAG